MTAEEELAELAARLVGQLELRRAVSILRASMVGAALKGSAGNATAAGRLLGVTRQAVQSARREHQRPEH